jgi:hypothetical protein
MLLRAQLPQAVGDWASIGAAPHNPTDAAAVALPDGRTLILGGQINGAPTDAVVVFDPTEGTFTNIGQLIAARTGHTATLLKDGRVVVAGGTVNDLLTGDLEIFDPSVGNSMLAATMSGMRSGHAAARLGDGTVLIAGGTSPDGVLQTAEIFDPETGTVMMTSASMHTPRTGASATMLIDGRVLIAGGSSDGVTDLASAEIYNPFTELFQLTDTNLDVPRSGHTAVLLPHNNSVLVAGGSSNGAAQPVADLFVPAQFPDPYSYGMGQFAPIRPMAAPRSGAVGGPHVEGYAFVLGGGTADTEVYRFATIKTDKDDYAPGQTAIISGSGWQPGEEVRLLFQEDPAVHNDYELTLTADGEGNIYWDQWAPETHDIGVRFYLLASDSKSRAQTTFTDGNLSSTMTFSIGPDPVAAGAPLAWSVSAKCADGGGVNTCASEGYTHGGNVQDGYSVQIEQATNAAFTIGLTVRGTSTTSSGAASGSFSAPTTGGPYFYRARHLNQNLLNSPVTGNNPNSWQPQSSSTVSISLIADTTAPSITPTVTGTLGSNNWYTSDVNVSWTVTDPESTVTSSTGCGPTTVTTDTTGLTFTCSATSAGGTASQSITIKRDATAPTATLAVTAGTAGSNGWYTSDVTVSTTGNDSISSPVTCTANQFQTSETTGNAFNGSCTNDAGLTTNAEPLTVKLDKTGPTAALAVTAGTAGANGWYTSDVTVSTTGSDSIASPVTCTADQFQTSETTGTAFNGSCTNDAGLTTNASALNVKLDKTGPTAAQAVTAGTAGTNDWYISDVTVSTTGADSISSPVVCSADQFQTAETIGQVFNGSCTNDAGLTTNAAPLSVKLDKTGPTAVLAVTAGTAGTNGWYVSDVSVSTTGTDSIASPVTCSADQFQTTETTGTPFNGSCTNAAGLTTNASALTVKLDKTGPTNLLLAVTAGTLGANGWYTSDVTVHTSSDAETISGPVICSADQFQTAETIGQVFNGSCTNDAGLTTNAAPLSVKLDKTGPTAVLAVSAGTAGTNGWYTSDVTVNTTGADTIASPVTCSADQFQTTETTGTPFNGSCTNDAGLSTNAAPLTVKLDKTGPTAAQAVTAGTLGTNGWYISDVTVSTTGADSISSPVICSADQFQTTETTGQAFNGSCTNDAGLTTNAVPLSVKLDKTGPTAVLAVSAGTAGTNGWYTSDVTVSTTGTDSIASPVTCSADQFQTTETTGTPFNGSCTNDAGLTTNASALTVKLDKTGPTNLLLAVTAGTLGANSWYTSDVTVHTSSDAETISGPVTCSADQFQTTETTGQAFNGSCTNDAGLTTNATALTVKLDKTGPTAVLAVSAGTAGTNGWYISNVTVSTTGNDSIASPVTCSTDQFQTTETTGTAFNGSCTNDAGLTTNATPLTVKLDKTAPINVLLAVTAGTLGNNGWYTGNVTVSTTGSDSVASPATCTVDQYQTTDTIGAVFNGSCTNDAGLTAAASPLTVKRDATAPVITITSPADGGAYLLNAALAADYACVDATSGTSSCAGPVADGANFNTGSIGAHNFLVNAIDNAGNPASATNSYSVGYASAGTCLGSPGHQILQPINADNSSVVKKGSTVPAKFRVCDANGQSIGTPGVVTSFLLIQVINGTVSTYPNEDPVSTTPDTAFRWSSSDQQWIFNVNTKNLTANRTYKYAIGLNDGSFIYFQFGTK